MSAVVSGPVAHAGSRGHMKSATTEICGRPLVDSASRGLKKKEEGGLIGRVTPCRRAGRFSRKCSDWSDGIPVAAASVVQRERSGSVRDLRSLDIQHQVRLPLLFGTKEDVGQLFDKMSHRVVSPVRSLISLSAHKECVERVVGVRYNPQDSVEEWPMHRGAYTSPLGHQGHSGKQRTAISVPLLIQPELLEES